MPCQNRPALAADTRDGEKFPLRAQIGAAHVAQAGVAKDHIWRHAALVGELFAQGAQLGEKRLVTGDAARFGDLCGPRSLFLFIFTNHDALMRCLDQRLPAFILHHARPSQLPS